MNKLHIDIAPHRVKDVRAYFRWLHQNNQITDDAHGNKIIAMLGVSFQADEPAIFSEPNEEYIEKEIEWYKSQSLNINDIYGDERPPPKAWQYAADEYGIINSNYGRLIFGDEFHNQYDQALNELQRNPHSRRASMIYNRPSIWVEYLNEDGMNDFICINAVTY